MEHPHALLMLVLRQHYHNRLHIIENAKKIIDDYKNDKNANYEKTLGVLYQLMNDLPPDILLYFLTMVPLPEGPMTTTSTLIGLMKQMHSTNLLNNMRPTLLQYLNNQIPPLTQIKKNPEQTTSEVIEIDETKPLNNNELKENEPETPVVPIKKKSTPVVRSVIDENIKKEKTKNKKRAKPKPKGPQKKTFQVKLLSLICALNILRHEKYYRTKYDNLKKEAWNIVNTKNISTEELEQCYNVIRDTNKKIKWLSVIKSGDVPLDVIKDEYGSSDVFYLEKHLQNLISDDVLELNKNLKNNIDNFLNKC